MKTILTSILLIGCMTVFSQHGHHQRGMKEMSPEQVATLETKKLTLALDLTEQQQKEIYQIEFDNAEFRKARMEERKVAKADGKGEKPSSDDRYAVMSNRLDRQIAHKEKMKTILNKSQFEKWEKLQGKREMRGKCKVHKGKPSR